MNYWSLLLFRRILIQSTILISLCGLPWHLRWLFTMLFGLIFTWLEHCYWVKVFQPNLPNWYFIIFHSFACTPNDPALHYAMCFTLITPMNVVILYDMLNPSVKNFFLATPLVCCVWLTCGLCKSDHVSNHKKIFSMDSCWFGCKASIPFYTILTLLVYTSRSFPAFEVHYFETRCPYHHIVTIHPRTAFCQRHFWHKMSSGHFWIPWQWQTNI